MRMKKYEAPMMFVDTFAPDTMIASGGSMNDAPLGCWGCDVVPGKIEDGVNACLGAGYPGC